jgi:mannose-6-phosphate isomerase-like protein (cupin superfamily)
MSIPIAYPSDRYHGESGEVSATYRPADHPPELVNPGGGGAHYLATGASTGGAFGLYRWEMGPGLGGPDPHFHRSISESFYVLSGTIRVYDGSRWIDTAPGDFVHVPEGGIHGFRNESGEPASLLLHFAPGAPREDYFETLADAARREAMDEEARAAFMFRHDTFWV